MRRAGSRRGAKATQDFREQTEGLYIQHRHQQRQNVMRQVQMQGDQPLVPVQDTKAEPKCPHSTMQQEVMQPLKEARLTGTDVRGISVTLGDKPVLDNDKVSRFTF